MIRETKILIVILASILIFVILVSIAGAKGAGSSSGITLTQPVSAKSAGIAEAYTAISGDVVSLHYNPSGLLSLKGKEVSFMYQSGFNGDNFTSIIYGMNIGSMAVGASILYYDTGDIEVYDSDGALVSNTGQRDMVLTVGGARKLYGFPLGVNIKVISSEVFGEKATAFALDLGAQYRGLIENLDLGFAVQNLGTELKYVDRGDPLPLTIRPGALYKMDIRGNPLEVSLDLPYYLEDEEMLAFLGVGYTYMNLITIRSGYRLNLRDASGEDESFNVGVGFTWKSYAFDYAMGITQDLSIPHRVSIQKRF